jgi:hypothetical protein
LNTTPPFLYTFCANIGGAMKKENFYKLAHYISGFVVILHGINEIDRWHGSPWFYFITGFLMLLVAVFHHRVEKFLKNGEGVIFLLEGAVQLFIAFHYFEVGKKALPFAHLLATMLYFYVGIMKLKGETPFRKK